MLKNNIKFKNFILKKRRSNNKKVLNTYKKLNKEKNEVLLSLGKNYKDSFSKKKIQKLKKRRNFSLIGMGAPFVDPNPIVNIVIPLSSIAENS